MGMSRLLSQKHTVEMLSKQVNQPNVSSVLTASWGTSVQAHAHGVPSKCRRGNVLNQSKC